MELLESIPQFPNLVELIPESDGVGDCASSGIGGIDSASSTSRNRMYSPILRGGANGRRGVPPPPASESYARIFSISGEIPVLLPLPDAPDYSVLDFNFDKIQ